MTFAEILSLLQTLSIVLAIIVALSTLKGRNDDKTKVLTEMVVDIKYIKETVKCIDPIKDKIAEIDAKATSALNLINAHVERHDAAGK